MSGRKPLFTAPTLAQHEWFKAVGGKDPNPMYTQQQCQARALYAEKKPIPPNPAISLHSGNYRQGYSRANSNYELIQAKRVLNRKISIPLHLHQYITKDKLRHPPNILGATWADVGARLNANRPLPISSDDIQLIQGLAQAEGAYQANNPLSATYALAHQNPEIGQQAQAMASNADFLMNQNFDRDGSGNLANRRPPNDPDDGPDGPGDPPAPPEHPRMRRARRQAEQETQIGADGNPLPPPPPPADAPAVEAANNVAEEMDGGMDPEEEAENNAAQDGANLDGDFNAGNAEMDDIFDELYDAEPDLDEIFANVPDDPMRQMIRRNRNLPENPNHYAGPYPNVPDEDPGRNIVPHMPGVPNNPIRRGAGGPPPPAPLDPNGPHGKPFFRRAPKANSLEEVMRQARQDRRDGVMGHDKRHKRYARDTTIDLFYEDAADGGRQADHLFVEPRRAPRIIRRDNGNVEQEKHAGKRDRYSEFYQDDHLHNAPRKARALPVAPLGVLFEPDPPPSDLSEPPWIDADEPDYDAWGPGNRRGIINIFDEGFKPGVRIIPGQTLKGKPTSSYDNGIINIFADRDAIAAERIAHNARTAAKAKQIREQGKRRK